MKRLINQLKVFSFLIIFTGFVYPMLMALFANTFFSQKASGSLLYKEINGKEVNGEKSIGSSLIAQEFKNPKYFWPRPSAVQFDPTSSGATHLSPDSYQLNKAIDERANANHLERKTNDDLLYASGSGLDPHISPNSAIRQLERISSARNLNNEKRELLKEILFANIEDRQWIILGEPRVNVLKLNLLIDERL